MARRYETIIPSRMIFKKFYCHKCGKVLKKHKTKDIYVEEKDTIVSFTGLSLNITFKPETIVHQTTYSFKCFDCHIITSYEDQDEINEIQKKLGKKFLNENELNDPINIEYALSKIKTRELINKILFYIFLGLLFLICLYCKTKFDL